MTRARIMAPLQRLAKRLVRPFWREPDFYIGGKENPYLFRWWVIPRNRFFNVYLHKFLRDDDDRALHDHPWVSLSVVLRGGYFEHMPFRLGYRPVGGIIFRRAVAAHRISLDTKAVYDLHSNYLGRRAVPAWTIFITGPRIREWGFHCPQGWRHWKEFTSEVDSGNVGKGCEP
jgi:hypothetical protein